ncbi:MAG: ATP-binding protein [Planctomycetota bacterium]|jgi:serine/threonine-protein kinase RsbW
MTSRKPINHSVTVESTSFAIIGVYERIRPELETNNFSQDDIFAVHLALEEAFINAITHGNKTAPDKEVKIEYSVGSDKIEISITDEGEGFNPNSVPDPRHGENLYKPQGRGLLLMNSYMDVVEFNERGNSVHMIRYKEKPRSTKTQIQAQA